MKDNKVRDYAYKAFILAKNNNCILDWRIKFKDLLLVLSDSCTMHKFIQSPLSHLCSSSITDAPEFKNYIFLLEENNLIKEFNKICTIFFKLLYKYHYCLDVLLESYMPVDTKFQIQIVEKLKKIYKVQDIFLDIQINKNLIGGVIIYVCGGAIDYSVKYKLQTIQI